MNQILDKKNIFSSNIYVEFGNDIFEIPYDETKKMFKLKQYIKKNKYKIQFIFSFCIALLFFLILSLNIIKSNFQEKISKKLLANYKLTTLYQSSSNKNVNTDNYSPFVIGIIKINKIDLNYPILSQTNEELLKISVCKFAGPFPNEIGNLCIVGHNYINNNFFSRLNELSIGDSIEIYDLNGNKMLYVIYQKKEVDSTDLSCTSQNTANQKIITLITCSNTNNSKRLIIKAKK